MIDPGELETYVHTLEGICAICAGDLKYIGDLGRESLFWCTDCGMEHTVAFGGER